MTCQMTGTSHEISQSFNATPLSLWLQPGILGHARHLRVSINRHLWEERVLLAGSLVTFFNQ